MSDKLNTDVFRQPDEMAPKTGAMPGMLPGLDAAAAEGRNLGEYVCRIFRGNIGGDEMEDLAMVESILTRGLAGNGDIIIVDRATQIFESNYWIILTYLEKRAR